MDETIKRWTAKRKKAVVIEIFKCKTTVSEVSQSYDLTPSEIKAWSEDTEKRMESSLQANLLDIHAQYEKHSKVCRWHQRTHFQAS